MTQSNKSFPFNAKLLRPAKPSSDTPWAFVILPKDTSAKLPRRGRTTIEGTINGYYFRATLEPDGQLSHWLQVTQELLNAAGADIGSIAKFKIMPVEQEPEPDVPSDLQEALAASLEVQAAWTIQAPSHAWTGYTG